jgi:transposase
MSEWAGTRVHRADRWFPSSKTCSGCGVVKTKLRQSERTFRCDECGSCSIAMSMLPVTSPHSSVR